MNRLRVILRIAIIIGCSDLVIAQSPTGETFEDQQSRILEEFIENLDAGEEFDFNTLFENLSYYADNPLNLNEIQYDDLKDLLILNDIQINAILQHRNTLGPFLSLYELQSIPALDLKTIRNLTPFVTVNEDSKDYFVGLGEMLTNGDHEIFLKWRRVLEKQRGYVEDASGNTPYIGDPNRLYMRYSYNYERRLKIGLTAEKDAGENMFSDPNQAGFDFYSAHLHLKDYNRRIKDLIIGDYSVSFGQGLILHNQFGSTKTSQVLDIKKGGRALKPYSSINEINFYRGVAASMYISSELEFTFFGSHKRIDGNTLELDTLNEDPEVQLFSSIVEDGLHRTEAEIRKENSIQQSSVGLQLKYRNNNTNISINGMYERFNKNFQRRELPYNQFLFSGNNLLNSSIAYSHQLKNIHIFGEMAISSGGGIAQTHGTLIGLDRKVDLVLLYRNYSRNYRSLQSNSFGETTGTNNEKGIYMGMEIRPVQNWTISAYSDLWKHDWLRFSRDAPTVGHEYLIKVNYYQRRKLDFYAQYRIEQKEENARSIGNQIDRLNPFTLQRLRVHLSYRLSDSWELRNRVEFSFYKDENKKTNGILVYQDVLYKSILSPFSFSARLAYFDTDDFDSRIYAYENDLIYEYFIPFYQNRGIRTYINLRYDIGYNMTAEIRASRTYFENRDLIGSGFDIIIGNTKTELKAQFRIKF